MLYANRMIKNSDEHILLCPSANIYTPLSHQSSLAKHTFKIKIISDVKKATAEHQTKLGPLRPWDAIVQVNHYKASPVVVYIVFI